MMFMNHCFAVEHGQELGTGSWNMHCNIFSERTHVLYHIFCHNFWVISKIIAQNLISKIQAALHDADIKLNIQLNIHDADI